MTQSIRCKIAVIVGLFFSVFPLYASFIEQTLGTAVVKDATAVFYNPAALTIVSKPQIILQGTTARTQFQFDGTAQNLPSGIIESGMSNTQSHFILPSVYLSIPVTSRFATGFALVANDFNRELDDHAVLRYVQARNQTDDADLVSAFGFKINEVLAVGGNLNVSQAHLKQEPISGIPRLNIPEGRSVNNARATSFGGDFGILFKPAKRTAIGFNYRSAITYHLSGSSILTAPDLLVSDDYHYKFWTPARSVLSVSHFLNETLGFIGTVQYLQWDIFKEASVYNFVTYGKSGPVIIPEARIRYNFHNSWLATLGTIYKISTKWVIRVAGTYNQSPSNGVFQISTGDSMIVGSSMGYQLTKNLAIDCSYGHGFFKGEPIHIATPQNIINGMNQADHDSVSLKLTVTG